MHTNRLIKSTLSTFLFSFIYIFRPSPLFDLTLKKNHITKWEKVFEKKTVHPKKKKTRMHPRYRISNIPRYKIRNLNTFVKRRVSVSLRNRIRKKKKREKKNTDTILHRNVSIKFLEGGGNEIEISGSLYRWKV